MRIPPLIPILTLLLTCRSLFGTPQAEFYVDPNLGLAGNAGALQSPFATIEEARDTVRTINSEMTGDIIVYLRGGIYQLDQAITLNAEDSGNNGFRIIYRNYPHEEPIIEGGSRITGWTSVGDGIFSAPVGDREFLQLYVNNQTARRARYPEAGAEFQIRRTVAGNKTIQLNLGQIEPWDHLNRIQMVIASSFTSCRLRIDNYVDNATSSVVTPMNPERESYFGWLAGPLEGTPSYFFENHLDFLDTPGEWFLDVDTDTVYYMPLPGESMATADVVAPQIEQLLHVEDTEAVTLFGITFQHATWMEPQTKGMVQRQASMRVLSTEDGAGGWNTTQFNVLPVATYFKRIKDVRIERCVFQKMGACAMGFDTGTQNNSVVGNVFSEVADTAVVYDLDNRRFDSGDDLSQLDTFDSNYFFRMGTQFYAGSGLFAFWPDRITITHNEIAHTNGLGMNVGWGATYDTTALNAPFVAYNRIHDTAVLARDSGGIHTKSDSNGGLYTENWIYNAYPRLNWNTGPVRHVYGVYLDDNTENTTVTDNVFLNLRDDDVQIKGRSNTVTGNSGQSQATKDNSGLRPEYADIKTFWRGGAIGRDLAPGEAWTGTPAPLGTLFDDTFDTEELGAAPSGYTIDTTGGTATVVNIPGNGNLSVRLRDTNSSNSAGAGLTKTFPEQEGVSVYEMRVKAGQTTNSLFLSLLDADGTRACQIGFSGNGRLRFLYQAGQFADLDNYTTGTWYRFRIEVDVERQQYSVWIDDELVLGDTLFFSPTGPITSLRVANSFQTGFFDIDSIKVLAGNVPSLVTAEGTPFSYLDQFYDTSAWTSEDYNLADMSDTDGDGLTGREEFLAGTVPTDGTSFLNLDVSSNDGDNFEFSWNTVRDRSYTIKESTDLSTWTNVSDFRYVEAQGNGGLSLFSTDFAESERFYQLHVKEN